MRSASAAVEGVESIYAKRITTSGEAQYFVKWKGFPVAQNTWETREDLTGGSSGRVLRAARVPSSARTEPREVVAAPGTPGASAASGSSFATQTVTAATAAAATTSSSTSAAASASAASSRHDQRHRHLRRRVCVAARRVHHNDAVLRGSVEVHVRHRDASAAYYLQPLPSAAQHALRDLRSVAHDDAVKRVEALRRQRFARHRLNSTLTQPLLAHRVQPVEQQHSPRRLKTVAKPSSSSRRSTHDLTKLIKFQKGFERQQSCLFFAPLFSASVSGGCIGSPETVSGGTGYRTNPRFERKKFKEH